MEIQTRPFALLRPVVAPWRPEVDPADLLTQATADDVRRATNGIERAEWVVVDVETRGTKWWLPDSELIGVGLAWRLPDGDHAAYVDLGSAEPDAVGALVSVLRAAADRLVAHNAMFDWPWLARRLGASTESWGLCTYALYRFAASEGWPGQRWGLKEAQVDLLGWSETNEAGIDDWLVRHGWVTNGPRRADGETREEYAVRVREWVAGGAQARPDKGEMWRVPPGILGAYCVLDCLSTLQLLHDVLLPACTEHPELLEFQRDVTVPFIRLMWLQMEAGLRLDRDAAEVHREWLAAKIAACRRQLREQLADGIAIMEEAKLVTLRAKEPPRYKVRHLGTEPARFKKDGGESLNWIKWAARRDAPPEERADWAAWAERVKAAENGELPEMKVNLASVDQLRILLYGGTVPAADGEVPVPGVVDIEHSGRTRKKKQAEVPVFVLHGVNGPVELDGTDGGLTPVNGDVYSQLPPALREPLELGAAAETEIGYVETYLRDAVQQADGSWRVYPGWRVPGTVSGRLAGAGGINLQQCPKTVEFMRFLVADPGHVWVEADAAALEPHVLAEMSQDPALLRLYGPGAAPHDVYLYSGARYAVLGERIRPHYPERDSAITPEVVRAAKKLCKTEREACKVVVLSKSYGAGWRKIHSSLRLRGVSVTPEDAQAISESHDALYARSGREYADRLLQEWRDNEGWVLDGLGQPTPVWEGLTKDIINRVIQRTGHSIHMRMVVETARALDAAGVEHTGVVWDFHDQLIVSVPTAAGEAAAECVRAAAGRVNEWLAGSVKIKYEPKLSTDMATAKEAEFSWIT